MFQYSQSFFTTTNVGHFVPFTFTGKERDEETDFTYHGAPYFDAALLTSWMAVDPMSDKYPSLSSDNYCAWNPVKLVDPDGREWDPSSKDIVNQYENDLKDRLKEASGNDRKEIQSALDELEILSMFDQMYHVEVGEVETPRARGETGWDYANKRVSITLAMDYSLAEIGHEMKHAYQFEIGEISYGKVKGIQDLLFDFSDERAAYNRGTALGGKSMADTQKKYNYNRTYKDSDGRLYYCYLFLSQDEVNEWHSDKTRNIGQNRIKNVNSNNCTLLSTQIYRKDGVIYGK